MSSPFSEHASEYRKHGFWPRPIEPNSKACRLPNWQRPDFELDPAQLERWREIPDAGIGLLTGSQFPDGTRLGVVDIDRNEYVPLARVLLGDPPCGRVGQKGIAFFVRLRGPVKNRGLTAVGPDRSTIRIGELLFDRTLCVIPPSIHPATQRPYQWVGRPLLETDYRDLPIIEAES